MTVTKKTKKKKLDKQSLTEFRAWLSGVEEMQEPGWIPNESQWELIRQRIDLIEDAATVVVNAGQQNHHYNNRMDVETSVQSEPLLPQVPTPFDRVQVVAPNSSSLTDIPAGAAPARRKPLVGSEKTPDIDSSSGYNSAFV